MRMLNDGAFQQFQVGGEGDDVVGINELDTFVIGAVGVDAVVLKGGIVVGIDAEGAQKPSEGRLVGVRVEKQAEGVGNLDFRGAGIDIYLLGTNLRTSEQGGQYKVKFYPADIISDYLVDTPVIEATATASATTGGVDLGIMLGSYAGLSRIQQCYMLTVQQVVEGFHPGELMWLLLTLHQVVPESQVGHDGHLCLGILLYIIFCHNLYILIMCTTMFMSD